MAALSRKPLWSSEFSCVEAACPRVGLFAIGVSYGGGGTRDVALMLPPAVELVHGKGNALSRAIERFGFGVDVA